ncbi:hypothetical protein QBC43DRAFT_312675 [Cladorrhinum sp. PSN259]|nr:hypothetical protein QBC43DRAFT_312675 [Cladorrhinum sp. PSN259]
MSQTLRRSDFTVAWVSPLPIELAAAQEMLDEEFDGYLVDLDDVSVYTFGRIGQHHVVLASLPAGQMGNNSAAAVAGRMLKDFPFLRSCLMVGIGGGVPVATADIRLGDIVVSQPQGQHGGVIQYDFGKATPNKFERTGYLNAPPPFLLTAVAKLQARQLRSKNEFMTFLSDLSKRQPMFSRDNAGPDRLFHAGYNHVPGQTTCDTCEHSYILERPARQNSLVTVHHGLVASGNQVIRDAATRDKISSDLGGILCFEMEAAGLMNSFPCLVIRGICDYSDSHKNKAWQPYAAATAAAYAKELLLSIAAPVTSDRHQRDGAIANPLSALPSIDQELEKAVDQFKSSSHLSHIDIAAFEGTKLSDLEAFMSNLQQKQSQSMSLRYMKRLEPFLAATKELAKVIEALTKNSDFMSFIWGPMKYNIQASSSLPDAFNSTLDVYESLGLEIPLLSSHQSLFVTKAYMRDILVMIFQDTLHFQIEVLRCFQQKAWQPLFQSSWKNLHPKIQRFKENFKQQRQLIESDGDLLAFQNFQRQRWSAEFNFEDQRQSDLTRRRTAALQWLSVAPLEAIHERHVQAMAINPNSGNWLLNDSRFRKWFDPKYCSTPLLWLNGKPGAGKSVLASRVIQEVREIPNISCAVFYCNDIDPTRNTFISVAKGLLSQLLAQDENLLLHVDKKMFESNEAVLLSTSLAKDLLKTGLKRRKTYIIIDGIDECPRDERKEICSFFRGVVDSLPEKRMDEIRCLFVSQDDGVARKDLSMLPTLPIGLDDNRCDIEAFSKHWETIIEEKFGFFPKDELDITKVVTEMSHGIFIFAKCVVAELYQQPTRRDLLNEWRGERFPRDLNEVYRRILNRVLGSGPKTKSNKITERLLGWITCATRPLRWYEIQGAISLDLDEETINSRDLRLVENAKDLCASLVEVHSDQTVQFIHPTVKSFLLTEKIINPQFTQHDLTSLSIRYLCFAHIAVAEKVMDMDAAILSGQYGFYDYAVATWVPHLLAWLPEAPSEEISVLGEDIEAFLNLHYHETEGSAKFKVSKTMEEKLRAFRRLPCFASLAQAVMWSRKLLLVDNHKDDSPDSNHLLDFPTITENVRSALENLVVGDQDDTVQQLHKYYGADLFKCPKIYCPHFYKGFSSPDDRDKHVNRHDRPYRCPHEGCWTFTFGCATKADLAKHMLQTHGNQAEFPELPDSKDDEKKRKRTRPQRFQCDQCGKGFTGGHNLRSHIRAHKGERPYTCSYCEKAFVRNADIKRHQLKCKKRPIPRP